MDNTEYLKQLAETEKKNKQIELEQAKAAALKSIEQEQATTMPTFTAKKQQASVQSQLGAKNLAEYWANRGQTQAGISQQAELSRQNVLGSTLGSIGQAEMAQQQAFQQQQQEAETSYQNQLTNFSNEVDQELTTNLYKDKIAQQEAAAEQEQYQQKLAQQDFENQLALAKYNLSANKQYSSSVPKTPLTKQGNYSNITIPYTTDKNKPITGAVVSGDKVVYQLSNGSTIKFDLGTNPYTGTLNKDAVKTVLNETTGKYEKVLSTFSNGYQPNNVNGTKLTNSGASVENSKNGEAVKVWTTNDGNYYYWDSTSNKYNKLSSSDKKAIGVK